MKINNVEVVGNLFAYDGCHKIYVLEDMDDVDDAGDAGYSILPISELKDVYNNSCELRFIHNWTLNNTYVYQFEDAMFEV